MGRLASSDIKEPNDSHNAGESDYGHRGDDPAKSPAPVVRACDLARSAIVGSGFRASCTQLRPRAMSMPGQWLRWAAVQPQLDGFASQRSTETPVIVLEPASGAADSFLL